MGRTIPLTLSGDEGGQFLAGSSTRAEEPDTLTWSPSPPASPGALSSPASRSYPSGPVGPPVAAVPSRCSCCCKDSWHSAESGHRRERAGTSLSSTRMRKDSTLSCAPALWSLHCNEMLQALIDTRIFNGIQVHMSVHLLHIKFSFTPLILPMPWLCLKQQLICDWKINLGTTYNYWLLFNTSLAPL